MSASPPTPSSSSSTPTPYTVQPGHVALFLLGRPDSEAEARMYLEIPLDILATKFVYGVKGLRFIAYCVLGVDGSISTQDSNSNLGAVLDDETPLVEREVYMFLPAGPINPSARADPDIIKKPESYEDWRHMHEDEESEFVGALMARDAKNLFKPVLYPIHRGMHIVPFECGSTWMQSIIKHRTTGHGSDLDLVDIDDVRNAMLGSGDAHMAFERGMWAVVVTPNPILTPTDIPPPSPPIRILAPGTTYPRPSPSPHPHPHPHRENATRPSRYTAQHFDPRVSECFPDNADGAFFSAADPSTYPSATLLHYRYGCAAFKMWGRTVAVGGSGSGDGESRDGDWIGMPARPPPAVVAADLRAKVAQRNHERDVQEVLKAEELKVKWELARQTGQTSVRFRDWPLEDVMGFVLSLAHGAKAQKQAEDVRKERAEAIEEWRRQV